jgi:hypothetical protein
MPLGTRLHHLIGTLVAKAFHCTMFCAKAAKARSPD